MIKQMKFGLIGKNITYSFSRKYFSEKFLKLELDNYSYDNFDLQKIDEFPSIIGKNIKSIQGLNVTIPYKLDIFKYIDEIDEDAEIIGAVNTIKILENGRLKGFNTDAYGFEQSLKPLLRNHIKSGLILGTGGASKAVAFVLDKLNIEYKYVSRNPINNQTVSYDELTEDIMMRHHLIINCTPIGTHPKIDDSPNIPYQFITNGHFLYDLIYNPSETQFLSIGKEKGAVIKNGLQMLELQADKAWEIWTS